MGAKKRTYSRMKHSLASAYGSQWSRRYLAVFTVYMDDSGTDPRAPVAIASGLILPTLRIVALEREWETLLGKEGFTCFHTSECVARNQHSEFAAWDDKWVARVLARIRQIIVKYSVKSFSIAINKQDHDEVIPTDLKRVVGKFHYTWAIDQVCGFINNWAEKEGVALEYVFDNVGKSEKREIETAMYHGEARFLGRFAGHFSFRKRCEVPALQCSDLFAWTCYQQASWRIKGKPLIALADESWNYFYRRKNEEWCEAWTATREKLENWVERVHADQSEMARLRALEPKIKERSNDRRNAGRESSTGAKNAEV
jgi:hypothetical protein